MHIWTIPPILFIRLLPHHLSDVLDDQILQQIHRLCVGILVITKAIHHTAHWGKKRKKFQQTTLL